MAPIQQAMVQTPIVSPLHRNTGFVQVASPSMPTQPPTDSGMRYEYPVSYTHLTLPTILRV